MMTALSLGIDLDKLSSVEQADPRCFECSLSECNPQNVRCALKTRRKSSAKPASADKAKSAIDMALAEKNIPWFLEHTHCWISASGKKLVQIIAYDPDEAMGCGVIGKLRKINRQWKLVTANERLYDWIMEGQPQEVLADDPGRAARVTAETHYAKSPAPEPTPKRKPDAVLLTIGVILDASDRDLAWAQWAIDRELALRRRP